MRLKFSVTYRLRKLIQQRVTSTGRQLLDTTRMQGLLAALVVSATIVSCSNRTELDPSVNELTFKTLSGTDVTLSDANGPTLVNFWSTSCVICIKEMPHLADFYRTHEANGLQIIAVAMSYDPPNEVVELAEQLRLPFPIALDITGEAGSAFGSIKGTPTSFLLDANGKLVERYIGAIDLDELEEQVNQLLGTG